MLKYILATLAILIGSTLVDPAGCVSADSAALSATAAAHGCKAPADCCGHRWTPFRNAAYRIHARREARHHGCCGCAGPVPAPVPPPTPEPKPPHHPHWPWQKGDPENPVNEHSEKAPANAAQPRVADGPQPVGNAAPANVE